MQPLPPHLICSSPQVAACVLQTKVNEGIWLNGCAGAALLSTPPSPPHPTHIHTCLIIHTVRRSVVCGLQLRQLPPGHIAVTPYSSSYHTAAQESAAAAPSKGCSRVHDVRNNNNNSLCCLLGGLLHAQALQHSAGAGNSGVLHSMAAHSTQKCSLFSILSVLQRPAAGLHLLQGSNRRVHHHPVPL